MAVYQQAIEYFYFFFIFHLRHQKINVRTKSKSNEKKKTTTTTTHNNVDSSTNICVWNRTSKSFINPQLYSQFFDKLLSLTTRKNRICLLANSFENRQWNYHVDNNDDYYYYYYFGAFFKFSDQNFSFFFISYLYDFS